MCYGYTRSEPSFLLEILHAAKSYILKKTERGMGMAYQAIYRKWRPMVFDDIIGQTHITRTLKNQIMSGKIAHAYLFCGTRGTGKTTAAKVFARAVNCEHTHDGSPCNECEICKGILDGSILDVSEIDAASNNGVDNIREIREDVNYVAAQTKYRVYIIDEVHMLSQGAFNALLKTLEEPPEHVIFILATTEAHRVPETILSRCQRFDFKRIRPADIIVRMKEIAAGDGLSISDDAYALLAKFADGSMRDGLSILERCVSECGTQLSYDDVVSVLGIAPSELVFKTVDAVLKKDTGGLLEIVDSLVADGRDLNVYIDLLIKHFRDLMVSKVTKDPGALLEQTADELALLKAQAEKISFESISYAVTTLTKAKAEAKWIKNPRIVYEIALVKLTQPELDTSEEALMARMAELEEKIKDGVVQRPPEKKEEKPKEQAKPQKEVSARLFVPIDKSKLTADSPIVEAARKWERLSQGIAKKFPYLAGAVINRKITIDGEGIILLFKKSEMMLKKIAVTYIKSIQTEFQKNVGGDFVFKTAFEDEIEDKIIDFWNIKGEAPKADTAEQTPSVMQEQRAERGERGDPLDTLSKKFPEIVEVTDESDFVDYTPEHYEQSELDEDEDEQEEFLEDGEKSQYNEER